MKHSRHSLGKRHPGATSKPSSDSPDSPDSPGSFPCDSHIVAAHGENLYTVEPNRVQIRTQQVRAGYVHFLLLVAGLVFGISQCMCVFFVP